VGFAQLEFTTNRDGLDEVTPFLNIDSFRRPRAAVKKGTWKRAKTVSDVSEAVFSSMDLPPLFPYTKIADAYFEDGGVTR
jgi:hypothetical protein